MSEVLRLDAVMRTYRSEAGMLPVLRGASVVLQAGEVVALMAPSGTGKSTLLHLAGLLDTPDGGRVMIEGREAGALSDAARSALRRDRIGFVYQAHHLLAEFSALENVMMPQRIAGVGRRAAAARAGALLDRLGMAARASHPPGKLSGGEAQRVAIARALANAPRLVLADEPTGNLDIATAELVFAALLDAARAEGAAALIATHNPDLARRMDRTVMLHQGRVVAAG